MVLAYNSQEVLHEDWRAEETGDSGDNGDLWPLGMAQAPPPPPPAPFTPFFTPPSRHH